MRPAANFLILGCLFCAIQQASAQHYPFVHYSPKEGLINNRVKSIYQDSKGKLYFATLGGLSIYDGTRFKNFTRENGLTNDVVNDFIEMGDDSVWIATNTSKLCYYAHDRLKTLQTADNFCPLINKFLKCKGGNLYALADDGLFLVRQNKFIRLPFIDSRGNDVGRFFLQALEWSHYLIVYPDHGLSSNTSELYLYDKTTNKILDEERNKSIFCISTGCRDEILISTLNGLLKLDTSEIKNGRIKYLPAGKIYENLNGYITGMFKDREGSLWSSMEYRKIVRLDSSGKTREFTVANGMSSPACTSIFQDREGSVWFCLNGAGVDKLVNNNLELYDQIDNAEIRGIYGFPGADSSFLYLASNKIVINGREGKQSELEIDGSSFMPSGFAADVNKIYICNGYEVYSLEKAGTSSRLSPKLMYRDTVDRAFGNILVDPYHNVVISGDSFITVLFNDKTFFRYPVNALADQVDMDSKNHLWVANRNGEFFALKINPNDHAHYLQLVKNININPLRLDSRCISVGADGTIWIGTRYNGLFSFQMDDQFNVRSHQQFTVRDGLSDNFITYLSHDNEGNTWVSTGGGVDRIKGKGQNLKIENISGSINFFDYIVKTVVDKNDIAWSVTGGGKLLRIGPSPKFSAHPPNLIISELRNGNNILNETDKAVFTYEQNNFSITVAATSYLDEKQIRYSYLLEGSGINRWSEPTNNSTFSFIKLVPGDYSLKMKAIFPAGRYSDQLLIYHFMVLPPWWQTWWFRLLLLAVVVTLVALVARSYFKRKLEKQRIQLEQQQAIEKERTRIATDMHDDLGAGLSRIKFLSETMKLKQSSDSFQQDLEKITNYSVEMVEKMGEIVWALNEKNDSLADLIAFTRSYATDYLSNNNIDCHVEAPDELTQQFLDGEKRRNIFLAVKECLHNVVKHAEASKVNFNVSLNDHLEIEIHDNGKGINMEQRRRFSNGIDNIKKRMESVSGFAEFHNTNGTKVVLVIPLK